MPLAVHRQIPLFAVHVVLLFLTLSSSLFFQGYRFVWYSATLTLLFIWFAYACSVNRTERLSIPATSLTILPVLYLLWGWLSSLWSVAPPISLLAAFWHGSFALTCGLYLVSQDRTKIWRSVRVVSQAVILWLGAFAVYQLFSGNSPQAYFLDRNSFAAFINLLAIPFAVQLTARLSRAVIRPDSETILLTVVTWVAVYAVGITQGRAAILSMVIAFVTALFFLSKLLNRRAVLLFTLLVVSALAAAHWSQAGSLVSRLATLNDPADAMSTRWLIWEGAWSMLHDAPWYGLGAGVFGCVYPRYRLYDETSTGAYAHNDFLQMGIEVGAPGLIIFALLLLALAVCYMRLIRTLDANKEQSEYVEVTGLMAAIGAVSIHSMVNFNFYTLSTLLVFGLYLGRLQEIMMPAAARIRLGFGRFSDGRPSRILPIAFFMIPISFFISLAVANYLADRSIALAGKGEIERADRLLQIASAIASPKDPFSTMRAMNYATVLRQGQNLEEAKRRALFEKGMELIEQAIRQNPIRAENYFTLGELYRHNRDLAGNDWYSKTRSAYENAVRLDPLSDLSRLALAKVLLENKNYRETWDILKEGMKYRLHKVTAAVMYYKPIAEEVAKVSDQEAAKNIRMEVEKFTKGFSP